MKALTIAWIITKVLWGITWRLSLAVLMLGVTIFLIMARIAQASASSGREAASWSPRF